jgi:hypothetical protein
MIRLRIVLLVRDTPSPSSSNLLLEVGRLVWTPERNVLGERGLRERKHEWVENDDSSLFGQLGASHMRGSLHIPRGIAIGRRLGDRGP